MVEKEKIDEFLKQIRRQRPIVHCITNAVTVNDCANVLLAVGASPTMAHHPLEVEEITAGASALVCNFGAIGDYEAMTKAGETAHSLGHAIVVDPVGVAGSGYRREKCQAFVEMVHPTCIRGNYSEIRALMEHCNTVTGVDAKDKNIDVEAMKQYALKYKTILIASGKTDVITDGTKVMYCDEGDELMARITGSCCMSSVLLGAFLSVSPDIEGAAVGCSFMGLAGERAAEKTKNSGGGTMTFHHYLIDEISFM